MDSTTGDIDTGFLHRSLITGITTRRRLNPDPVTGTGVGGGRWVKTSGSVGSPPGTNRVLFDDSSRVHGKTRGPGTWVRRSTKRSRTFLARTKRRRRCSLQNGRLDLSREWNSESRTERSKFDRRLKSIRIKKVYLFLSYLSSFLTSTTKEFEIVLTTQRPRCYSTI